MAISMKVPSALKLSKNLARCCPFASLPCRIFKQVATDNNLIWGLESTPPQSSNRRVTRRSKNYWECLTHQSPGKSDPDRNDNNMTFTDADFTTPCNCDVSFVEQLGNISVNSRDLNFGFSFDWVVTIGLLSNSE